jgi:hypothetical protein
VDVELVDDRSIWIPSLGGVSHIPAGWSARISIDQIEGLPLQVSASPSGEITSIGFDQDVWLESESCGMVPKPLGLRIQGAPGHYVIHVEPVLRPAYCKH